MEQDKFEDYILYGTQENISIRQCIKNEVLIILFSLPIIIIEKENAFFILGMLPMICYFISIVALAKEGKIQGIYYILQNGIFSVCMSFLFALAGVKILLYLFSGSKKIFLLCVVSIGYFAITLLYCYIIKTLIERRAFNGFKKTNGRLFFMLCGILGISIARIIMKDMSNEAALEILCIGCFFLSYLLILGTFNLIKFYYIVKHKELLQ